MPMFKMGRAALIGAAGMAFAFSASGAMAASEDVVVSSHDSRSVSVNLAGYNAASDQLGLDARIDRAARQVCDVNGGSKLDASPKARACLASARDGAEAQLRAMGHSAPRMAMATAK